MQSLLFLSLHNFLTFSSSRRRSYIRAEHWIYKYFTFPNHLAVWLWAGSLASLLPNFPVAKRGWQM